jgi:lipopolysaccharide transport system permease protein
LSPLQGHRYGESERYALPTIEPTSRVSHEESVLTAPTSVPVLELVGERTSISSLLRDVWRHRDLMVMLAKQDYRSRYRSASLGLAWAVFLPLLQGVVIAVVFTRLTGGGKASSFIPYVIGGITAFSFVSSGVTASSTSIVDNGAIAGRLYFPRLVLPTLTPTANLPGLLISYALAMIISLATGGRPGWWVLLAPVAVVMLWLLVVSSGALLTMLHVYSRDVRYIVQASLLVLFYATPVIYLLDGPAGTLHLPSSLVPFVIANPITGVVQLVRLTLLGHAAHAGVAIAVTGGWIAVMLVASVFVYARLERVACDRL